MAVGLGTVPFFAAQKPILPRDATVALHEPLKAASPRIAEFRRIAQNEHALAVAVVGRPQPSVGHVPCPTEWPGINDRVMLRYGDDAAKAITLAGDGESFTFADYVYVRIGEEKVEVSGRPQAMQVRVQGHPKLVVNGKGRGCTIADGLLTFAE